MSWISFCANENSSACTNSRLKNSSPPFYRQSKAKSTISMDFDDDDDDGDL
jgi:hypothetical protein